MKIDFPSRVRFLIVCVLLACSILGLGWIATGVEAGRPALELRSGVDEAGSSPFGLAPFGTDPPLWTDEGDQEGARFGVDVADAGDVNGDGYGDFIVGAYMYDNPDVDEGAVFLYYGSASGPLASPDWTFELNQAGAWLGNRVAAAGDVNGDGYDDVAISAQRYDGVHDNEGIVLVFHGGPSGLTGSPAWTVKGDQEGANLTSIGGNGDVNGDDYSDLVVGAIFYDGSYEDDGAAYCYLGGPSGLSSTPAWTASGDAPFAYFGYDVAMNGDVNGDGYSDIVVGARGPHEAPPEGRVFVYHGSASGPSTSYDWVGQLDQYDTGFGGRVEICGDVNGDGYDDLLVGASGYDGGDENEGGAFVFHGGASGLSELPDWTGEPDQEFAGYGTRVSGARDVDGDGYDDVLVIAYLYDTEEMDAGRAYLYYGGESGLDEHAGWIVDGDQSGGWLGLGIAGVGDQIPGGNLEVLIGAPGEGDNLEPQEGVAYLFTPTYSPPPVNEPVITSIIDYPQDEGGMVILNWRRSEHDASGVKEITHYSVWRRYQGGGTSTAHSFSVQGEPEIPRSPASESALALASYGWEYVADSPARYLDEYAMSVPTYADSNDAGIPYTGFIVMAHTVDPWVFYVSDPDSGYSVDNLPPECPTQLAGEYIEGSGVCLSWRGNPESDLADYAIYRAYSPDALTADLRPVATVADTVFTDSAYGDRPHYYRVAARDKNGNEGPGALLSPDEIANNPWSERSHSGLLLQNVPNPFMASTEIAFSVAKEGRVKLLIFDAMGRRVRVLVDEERRPDNYVEVWDGRDDEGRPLSPGTYFYLLQAPGWKGGKKMTLAR